MAYHYHDPGGYYKEYEYPQIEEWNLISAGPSIGRLRPHELIEGAPVCAVNGAVMHEKIRANFWSWQENPKSAALTISHCQMKPPNIVWGNIGFESDWNRYARRKREKGRGNLTPVLNDRAVDAFNKDLPWETSVVWTPRPITSTLGIIMKHGAKRVRVFGVDMVGDVDFAGNDVLTTAPIKEVRWKQERQQWAACVKECQENGVVIEWLTPEGAVR